MSLKFLRRASASPQVYFSITFLDVAGCLYNIQTWDALVKVVIVDSFNNLEASFTPESLKLTSVAKANTFTLYVFLNSVVF